MKLLFDFFPILLFFIAYKTFGIYAATAVAIAAAVIQNAIFWFRHRRFENMHLITLGLITVLGGATLILQDKSFIMWKPSAVNWMFAIAFIGSQFFGEKTLVERMMSHAIEIPRPAWTRLNLSWVVFFIAMGFANLYVANFYFIAEAALTAAANAPVEIEDCAAQFNGELLALCQTAHEAEEQWVNFKLFGMMGLTILFVIGQAFYLARHVKDNDDDLTEVEQES
ncbi:Intracellular septation protein IspA [hydrothermal vent metagenome]|uniref:Intracellular septation protein IspA n=1 Tax=hydrothermal vent metagenome TaxID=652676 RepID=A0A3B1BCD0_9ZZZZ